MALTSCSKDDDAPASNIIKEYPENMIQEWTGSVSSNDFVDNPTTALQWNLKPNGRLEVRNGTQALIIGEWYMIGNIFTCKYTAATGQEFTYQLIKNNNLIMIGFTGLNGDTSGNGRVFILVV